MEVITNFLYQIVFSAGVIVAFGLLITLCRRAFCKFIGEKGPKILLITGIVGTPIHELSHAVMCVIFGHKIQEVKLYQPNADDGTLGYVNHSYNERNLYHQIGNFFIGIAPILGGTAALSLLMYFLVPDIYAEVMAELEFAVLLSTDLLDVSTYTGYLELFWEVLSDIFDTAYSEDLRWWIFIVLALMISSHMELSIADIKSGLQGFAFAAGVLLVADVVLYFVSISALEAVTAAMTSFALSIGGFLAVSAVFAGALVVIALAINGVKLIK